MKAKTITGKDVIDYKILTKRLVNGEFDNPADLFYLFKGDVHYLFMSSLMNERELYNEAYEEGKLITIKKPFSEYMTVQVVDELNVTETTKHLISNLQLSDNTTVYYKGPHTIKSIRDAVFRLKDFYSDRLRVSGSTGSISISENPRDKNTDHSLSFLLERSPNGTPFEIPLNMYRTVPRLRSAMQRYGDRNKFKFVTRVKGDKLEVVKSRIDSDREINYNEVVRNYLKNIPFDTTQIIEYSFFKGLSETKVKSLLRNFGENMITFRDDTFTRHTFRVFRDKGFYKLAHSGRIVYETPEKSLTSIDKAVMNNYLAGFGRALVNRKIVKV